MKQEKEIVIAVQTYLTMDDLSNLFKSLNISNSQIYYMRQTLTDRGISEK